MHYAERKAARGSQMNAERRARGAESSTRRGGQSSAQEEKRELVSPDRRRGWPATRRGGHGFIWPDRKQRSASRRAAARGWYRDRVSGGLQQKQRAADATRGHIYRYSRSVRAYCRQGTGLCILIRAQRVSIEMSGGRRGERVLHERPPLPQT